jgi:hypothetical protein
MDGGASDAEYSSTRRNPDEGRPFCPGCQSQNVRRQNDGQWKCSGCKSTFGSLASIGKATENLTGEISLPGGPVNTSERALVTLTCLDPQALVEIDVRGTKTRHNRGSLPEALRYRLSPYGRHLRPHFMPKVMEWLYSKAKPGDVACFDLSGNDAYVIDGKGQFRYASSKGHL